MFFCIVGHILLIFCYDLFVLTTLLGCLRGSVCGSRYAGAGRSGKVPLESMTFICSMSVKGGLPDGSRGRGRDRRPQEERWTPGDPSLHCVPVHLQRPRQQDQRQRFKMSSENNPFARDDGDFERKYKAGPINHRFDGRSSCCLS